MTTTTTTTTHTQGLKDLVNVSQQGRCRLARMLQRLLTRLVQLSILTMQEKPPILELHLENVKVAVDCCGDGGGLDLLLSLLTLDEHRQGRHFLSTLANTGNLSFVKLLERNDVMARRAMWMSLTLQCLILVNHERMTTSPTHKDVVRQTITNHTLTRVQSTHASTTRPTTTTTRKQWTQLVVVTTTTTTSCRRPGCWTAAAGGWFHNDKGFFR